MLQRADTEAGLTSERFERSTVRFDLLASKTEGGVVKGGASPSGRLISRASRATMAQRTPPTVGFSPPKFAADDPALLEYLETYGYAVVGSVANSQQVARAHDDFWEFHEGIGTLDGATQVLRRDSETWGNDFLPHPATGIITGYGFGQSRFCWNLRTLQAVPKVFSKIWGTDDLVTSFDGGAAFRPWSADDTEWKTQGGWWHCDQNATRPGRSGKVCVQGLVQLTPANEWTGGASPSPRAHAHHAT